MRVMIFWQSLVVSAYRSFFDHLAECSTDLEITLVAPKVGKELGGQEILCAEFRRPFESGRPRPGRHFAATLESFFPHVQSWIPFGVGNLVAERKPEVVVCFAEPYSLTLPWIVGRIDAAACAPPAVIAYAAQNIQKEQAFPLRKIQEAMFRRIDALLVTGSEQAEVARNQGWSGENWYFPLWFDEDRFFLREDSRLTALMGSPSPEALSSGPVVGFAGSVSEEKGVGDLLSALELLPPERTPLTFLIAGHGSMLQEINAKASLLKRKGIDVIALGPLAAEQMPDFFSSLDILVVPSRTLPHWKEQFGRVIVEAQACGVEVLGSKSGEIPFVVGDPVLIFPERSPIGLAKVLDERLRFAACRSLREREVRRRQLSETAHREYSSRVLAERFSARLVEFYSKRGSI